MNRQYSRQDKIDSILAEWNASISSDMVNKLTRLQARRGFLTDILKSTAVVSSLPLWSVLQACDRQSANQKLLQQHPWQTFAAVQQHLFPDDGNGPSASDVNATLYLKFVLDAPDTDEDDKTFVLNGIKWLNELSDERFGAPFVSLKYKEQDRALKNIASSTAGERWLSHLLLYIMEALLTDPVYGGNPDGVGWQWLEHQPGFPRPGKHRRYMNLL